MALVNANSGKNIMEDCIFKTASPEALVYKLYTNNYTPLATSVASSFTEASFTGYSAQTLSRSGWGASVVTSGVATSTYGSVLSWTNGSGSSVSIYGYFVVGGTSGTLYYAELFSGGPIVMSPSYVFNLTPSYTFQ